MTSCWRGICGSVVVDSATTVQTCSEIRSKAAPVAVYDLYGGEFEEPIYYEAVVPGQFLSKLAIWEHKVCCKVWH